MDIGKIIEVGTREIPAYKPAPTMVPVEPERTEAPEPQRERAPERERETVKE